MPNLLPKTRILVIGVEDDRKRYQFLMEPLRNIEAVESIAVLKNKSYLFFLPKLLITVCRLKPDIIIAVEADMIGLSAILINKLTFLNRPVILRSGGDSLSPRLNAFNRFLASQNGRSLKETLRFFKYKLLYIISMYVHNRCSHFILVSNHYATELRKIINLKNRKIFVVPQSRTVKNTNKRKTRPKKDRIRLLTVTNLEYEGKYSGVLELVGFLQRFVNQDSFKDNMFFYDICGDGYYYNHLLNHIDTINNGNNRLCIHCHGYVKDLRRYYKSADLFIYASYFDALPNVLLEAQAYGLPILVNDYRAFHEFIIDYWNAVFYKSGDFQSFGEKLNALVANSRLRQRLSTNGIKNIMENYSAREIAVRLERVINEILRSFK